MGLSLERHCVVVVGTQKGLFCFRSDPSRRRWSIDGPHIAGYEIAHAWLDGRVPGRGYAAANHPIWGAHVHRSDDGGKTWEALAHAPCHTRSGDRAALEAIWFLAPGPADQPSVLYAGIDPPGLFVSEDHGDRFDPVAGLNEHPTRPSWEPARGGFAVHSIYVDPEDRRRLYAAVSAGGAFRSDDGGVSFRPINCGVRAENLPNPHPETGHNIHRLIMHPVRSDRLYRQCYNGSYRSDDRGETWSEITDGLPSDFGYAIAACPADPDMVFVIPEESRHMRTTVGRKLRVYRSLDGGRRWEPGTRGLPQEHVYVTVLREALCTDGLDPCGVYFGTSSGHLFASRDRGVHWELLASFLPRILSVQVGLYE